jgi:hypothetical protein
VKVFLIKRPLGKSTLFLRTSPAVCHDIRDFVFEFSALACFRQKLGDQFCNQCRGTVLRHRCSTNRSAINGDLGRLCAISIFSFDPKTDS